MNLQQLLRAKYIIDIIKQKNGRIRKTEIFDAVNSKLERMNAIYNKDYKSIAGRTLDRDIESIRKVLDINIEYENEVYSIEEKDRSSTEVSQLLDNTELAHLFSNYQEVKDYIALEPRKMKQGIDHFFPLLSAIKSKKKVKFFYTKYNNPDLKERIVSPLGLKEYKGFWYLIALSDKIKSYGLDRILNLDLIKENAIWPENFSLKNHFKNCFGIVRFDDEEPQEIQIKASKIKADYYKANPLHHSQDPIIETNDYTIFSLYIYLTYDFQQEILSHGSEVEIIKPEGGMKIMRYY